MLAHPQLPPGLINHCLDVMLVIMDSERDLIRIVVEIVIDLRDEDVGMEENPNSTVCPVVICDCLTSSLLNCTDEPERGRHDDVVGHPEPRPLCAAEGAR